MSDVPALGELARRATAVIDAREAGTAIPPDDRATPEFQAYCLALVAFREAATPDAVLQLVALATGGAETEEQARAEGFRSAYNTCLPDQGADAWKYHYGVWRGNVARASRPPSGADDAR
jgi:hypothetical protein